MRIITEERLREVELELDEKYNIVEMFENKPDEYAYNGMVRMLYSLGFDVERDEANHHTIYGNYAD